MVLAVFRAGRTGGPAELGQLAALSRWLAPRVFLPSILAVGVSGVLLALDGNWPLGALWLELALAGYGAALLTQFLYRNPEVKRIARANATHGPGNPESARRIRQLVLVGRAELVLLFLLAADMVLKPTASDTALLAAGAAILTLTAVAAVAAGARTRPATRGGEAAVGDR